MTMEQRQIAAHAKRMPFTSSFTPISPVDLFTGTAHKMLGAGAAEAAHRASETRALLEHLRDTTHEIAIKQRCEAVVGARS